MRPPRRILPSLVCSVLAVSVFAFAASTTVAQTAGQLPHAWSEAVFSLAEKIAAVLGTSRSFVLQVNEVSTVAAVDPASIRQTLEDDIAVRGARSVSAPADAQVQVTISENLGGFVLVAEIRRQDAQQVAVVPVAGTDELPP